MSARIIAIGDIHGCSAALRALLDAIHPLADDTLVLLGDYVDRGPDSHGVIDLVLELENRCRVVPLVGNHELMLLDAVENPRAIGAWLECGGAATVRSYGQLKAIPSEHLEFIRRCRRYYETPTHFFVHANYAADVPLDQQPDYLLFWEHLHFHLPARHENGKIAVVGHTSQKTREVFDLGYVICIDTFCHGGGWLTALDVGSGEVWQAGRDGRLRGARNHDNS
jgi:calcineurin-like phosphoesterase family protein